MVGSRIRPGPHRLAEIEVDPELARIHEHGWQSWSPTPTSTRGALARTRELLANLPSEPFVAS